MVLPIRIFSLLLLSVTFFACTERSIDTIDHFPAPEGAEEWNSDGLNVAFLIMDGTYNTELTAPMDIFHHTKFRDDIEAMNVFTIAETLDDITTFEGLTIKPDYSYQHIHPTIDILVIPSAEHHLDSDLDNEQLIQFVQKTDQQATFMTSHCDGAFVLAEAGLLDSVHCTTFPADRAEMKTRYPQVIMHDSCVFVHDGKYITSEGGAKSFEASLYLVEHLFGKENADQIAEGMVIDWNLNEINHYIQP